MTANANRELRATLVTLGFGAFACQASVRICDAMLPQLSQEFGVSIAAASAVIAAFVIAYGLSQLLHGPLGDRFGKLRVFRIASSMCFSWLASYGLMTTRRASGTLIDES